MEEVSITETESRYFGDLFLCCDAENTGKVPILKATEMFRSANLSNDVIRQVSGVSGASRESVPQSIYVILDGWWLVFCRVCIL